MAKKQYIPSYKRIVSPPGMRVTERDISVVNSIYQYRILNSRQIEVLHFQSDKPKGKRTVCQRRLQLLFHHGFIDRLPIPVILGEGRAPYTYVLDEKGADLIAGQQNVDRNKLLWKPMSNQVGFSFIAHTGAINDFRIVVSLLAQNECFELLEWLDEAYLKSHSENAPYLQRGSRITRKYPDGYFKIVLPDNPAPLHFFLEVDMGTESNAIWKEKIKAYVGFRQSGNSERIYETTNFRVLTLTTSKLRLKNLVQATEQAGGDHFFWFALNKDFSILEPNRLFDQSWQIATKLESQFLV